MKTKDLINRLTESSHSAILNKFKSLPDELKAELIEDRDVKAYYCDNCHKYVEPKTENVDMEDYYGVGGDFPDHHHEEMTVCPICGNTLGLPENISFEDVYEAFIDYDYDEVYQEFSETYPELITSDTIIDEEYPDEVAEVIKGLL